MECSDIAGVYKRRKPQETSLWKLLNGHFVEFEDVYDELFQKKYGFYRPVISHVVPKGHKCESILNVEIFTRARSLAVLAYLPQLS